MSDSGLRVVVTRAPRVLSSLGAHARLAGYQTVRPRGTAIHRLHRADCRFARGSLARAMTFEQWQLEQSFATERDEYRLCRVCRPEESA